MHNLLSEKMRLCFSVCVLRTPMRARWTFSALGKLLAAPCSERDRWISSGREAVTRIYLASMALIIYWVVSQPHTRTIILGDWKRIIQCQWEERNAGNETDILYVCQGVGRSEEDKVGGAVSVLLSKFPCHLRSLLPLHRNTIVMSCKNAFDKAPVWLTLQPT